MIVSKEDISSRLNNITRLVADQAEHGAQTKIIQKVKPSYFALGQFLRDLQRTQRGIHGSAMGLRVLADSSNNTVINGLTRYLEDREEVERQIAETEGGIDLAKLDRDSQNTIKLSEILYSLKFVKSGSANKESLVNNTSTRILNSLVESSPLKGWGYYLGDHAAEVDLLPTSFAILGLSVNGFRVDGVVDSVRANLKNVRIDSPTKLSIVIFSLFALLTGVGDYEEYKNEYHAVLNRIWASSYCSLKDIYEQNIEYWTGTHHDYVRIPWQLYLISITSKISPQKFYTIHSQKLLNEIVSQDGFRYKYSGPNISTRTNSILYLTLEQIRENIMVSTWHRVLLLVDKLRTIIGAAAARYTLMALGLVAVSVSIYRWTKNGKADLAELAPEILAGFVIALTTLGKRK